MSGFKKKNYYHNHNLERERERERERRPRRKEKEKGRGNVPTYSPGNQKTKNKSNVQERKKRGGGVKRQCAQHKK